MEDSFQPQRPFRSFECIAIRVHREFLQAQTKWCRPPHNTDIIAIHMDRAKATQQLERIVAAAEAGDFPVQVTALYVFGSFARGALKPGDLDLVVVYEPPPAESPIHRTGKCMQRDRDGLYHRRLSEDELTTMMREVMCQPGEAIDTVFVTSFDEIRLSSRWEKIADSKFVLVWSKTSRDWRANLAAIKPNEAAGRWNRSRFTGASLFRCDITTMDQVGDALRQNVLAVTCISAQEITLNFNTEDQQWLDGLRDQVHGTAIPETPSVRHLVDAATGKHATCQTCTCRSSGRPGEPGRQIHRLFRPTFTPQSF